MNTKLGICNFCVPGTGVFAPKFVALAGLDGMSIEFGTYENHYPTATRQVQDAYLEAAEQYKIEYCNIGCSGFDFIPFNAHRGHPMHEVVKGTIRSAIDSAAYMGIPMVFVPSFGASSIENEDDMTNTIRMFKYACDYARDKGIQISSENKLDADRAIELYESVNADNFSLFYDSNNYFFQKGYDQLELLKKLYPYLGSQLHVKDGKPGVLAGSLLGEGDAGFYDVVNYLRNQNYNGWLVMENLYEKQPTIGFETDVFALFLRDVEILKKAVQGVKN